MASNRHLGRIIALQTLYEEEFRREANDAVFDLEEVLRRNIARYSDMVEDVAFIKALVHGVCEHLSELDAILQPIAPEWPIDQIARMDRIVLRIGLYELLYARDIPPKVVINEAVELAKAFGGENSSKFVNGVLGTVLRQRTDTGANASLSDDRIDDAKDAKQPAAKKTQAKDRAKSNEPADEAAANKKPKSKKAEVN